MLASSAPDAPEAILAIVEVDIVRGQLHFLGVNLQDLLRGPSGRAAPPAHGGRNGRDAEAPGPGIRTVGGGQDDDAVVARKAIHLGEQLVQSLLTLVVAEDPPLSRFLTDGIDLIDEHDAGRLFVGLLKQIPHLGCSGPRTSPRTPNRKWRRRAHWLLLPQPSQHGLACAGRAHQQSALRHGSANVLVLARIVQVVHHLLQDFLGFILTGDIIEANAGFGLHINLGVAFAEGHGIHASAAFHHLAHCKLADGNHDDNGQDPGSERKVTRKGCCFTISVPKVAPDA